MMGLAAEERYIYKVARKICIGTDFGAEAAFDNLGNDDGWVDEFEIVDAADFSAVTAKVNKIRAKINTIRDQGGEECKAHSPESPDTISPATIEEVRADVASLLNGYCY